jgi:hypothetical protein
MWHSLIEVVRKPNLHVLRETGSTLDVRLTPCKSGYSGASFSNYSGYDIYNGGPLTGNQSNNMIISIVVSCL